jgi:2-haloacid dehalogenase
MEGGDSAMPEKSGKSETPRVCVFDVNETLLDLSALDPRFEEAFGESPGTAIRKEWFGQLLTSWLTATVTGVYHNFGELGLSALEMVAARRGVELPGETKRWIVGGVRELPPHPEVEESLSRLRENGLRLAALTNSTAEVANEQLSGAGLSGYFEQILSADEVGRLKPAPEPYRMAADRLGVGMDGIRLVAAHAWDVAGAMRAGCSAAFVARPGMVLDPLAETPDIVGSDLAETADKILRTESA